MNGLKHPASHHFNLVLETSDDRQACRRALGLGGVGYEKILEVGRLSTPSVLETGTTETIARNLARISLGAYGESGFSGLTRQAACQKLAELSGDVDEFFRPILSQA